MSLEKMRAKPNHGFSFYTSHGWFRRRVAKDPAFADMIQGPAHCLQLRNAQISDPGLGTAPIRNIMRSMVP